MSKQNWGHYKNGNYNVVISFKDGTKVRYNNEDKLVPDTIENFDYCITNFCDNGCPFCLPLGAKLYKEEQPILIENIQIGDKVLSYNLEKNMKEYKRVIDKYVRPFNGNLICIEDNNGHILKVTPNHKIYTQRGYIRADELKIDDELLTI